MYKVVYSKQADKFLEKHPEVRARIKTVFKEIKDNPYFKIKNYDISPLGGLDNTYRLRKGSYRAIFEIRDKEVIIKVIKIDNRGDAY